MTKDAAFNKFMRGYSFALSDDEIEIAKEAWQACKEALEQPTTQEPVAYYKEWEDKSGKHKDIKFEQTEGYRALFLYQTKEWNGLTAEEINSIPLNENTVQTVENILRSKNTCI